MRNINNIQKLIKPVLCGLCLILTGCSAASLAHESTFASSYENGEEEEAVNIYTSDASVIIEGINEEEQTITMHLINRNESRTLSYSGATLVWDKYGSAITMAQLGAGAIADISYNDELEKVGSISLSKDAWSYEGVDRYVLDAGNKSAAIGDEMYSIGGDVMVFSDGKTIDTSQIIRHDVLSFHGIDYNIMSITVDKGHGYLKLENEDAVLGGWIEIGQAVISQIAPDMLFTVPEGSYTVRLSADGVEETREVTIERNRETVLNLEDIEIPESEDGVVTFEITPTPSVVYVDDIKIETKYPVKLSLGLHQVTAEASGYETLSQYFQVEGKSTTVKMNLVERATVSGNSITNNTEEEKKASTVTIDTPRDVEVYQDNLYMGIAPVTYDKTPGEHTITLRKTGYITRSYSINIADDDEDVTYSFPDLDPENSDNTISGNKLNEDTVSGNKLDEDNLNKKKNENSQGSTGNQGSSGNKNNTGNNSSTGNSGNADSNNSNDKTVSGNTVSGNALKEDSN